MWKRFLHHPMKVGLSSFLILLSFLAAFNSFAQGGSCVFDTVNKSNPKNFYALKHKQVTGLSIAAGMFRGLLEYTPAGYYTPGNVKKYPVIIYFHGKGAIGGGTTKDLCKILYDSYAAAGYSLPGLIEKGTFPTAVSYGGVSYSYIVISPQFKVYNYPTAFPSAKEVDSIIRYVKKKYRIDTTRIYLTGLSTGANMVIEYAGSSIANSKKVAAIGLSSLCSDVKSATNVSKGIKPDNIAAAKLPTWFIQCQRDTPCVLTIPKKWVDSIVKKGGKPPVFTILTTTNTNPLLKCNTILPHNTWSTFYNPAFRVNTKNLYEFFIQFKSPPAISIMSVNSFSATAVNSKVDLAWNSSDETAGPPFIIEKAGMDGNFIPIATVPSAARKEIQQIYRFTDKAPFASLNLYRIKQMDEDGQVQYSEIRKILNRKAHENIVAVYPNPFNNEVSAIIQLDKKQKISISITDINGRRLSSEEGVYGEGTNDIILKPASLATGIYFLKVNGESFTEIHKIIKQ